MKNYSITRKIDFVVDDESENGLALGNYLRNNGFIDITPCSSAPKRRGGAGVAAALIALVLIAGTVFWAFRLNKETEQLLVTANEHISSQAETEEAASEAESEAASEDETSPEGDPFLPDIEYAVTYMGYLTIYTHPDEASMVSDRVLPPGMEISPKARYFNTYTNEEWHCFEYVFDGFSYSGWVQAKYLTEQAPE